MNYSTYRITLDVRKTVSSVQLTAKKGDAGRKVYITLSDKGNPCEIADDSYAVFAGVKPDGTLLYNKTTIENNTIIYEMTQQTTAVPGLVECEVKLFDSMSNLLTSPKLTILVDDVVVPDEEIVSKDEITAFAELILDATVSRELATAAANAANEAATHAQTATEAANSATASANQAAQSANTAAGNAQTGANNATQAAAAANQAAEAANQEAANANTAANEANTFLAEANTALQTIHDIVVDNEDAPAIECDSKGEVITLKDSSNRLVRGLNIYGKTTQDGTPTPENPVELVTVGGDGNIGVTVLGKNLFGGDALADKFVEQLSATLDTNEKTISYVARNVSDKTLFTNFKPNTQYTFIFKGMATDKHLNIRISYTDGTEETAWRFSEPDNLSTFLFVSNSTKSVERLKGTYNSGTTTLYYEECGIFEGVLTQADFEPYKAPQTLTAQTPNGLPGIGDVRDEIDFAKGVHVQRIGSVDLGTIAWEYRAFSNNRHVFITYDIPNIAPCKSENVPANAMCELYRATTQVATWQHGDMAYHSVNGYTFDFVNNNYTDSASFKTAMSGVMLMYELAEPIYHDLSAEELAQYAKLHTNKPNTTVFNDANAYMELEYVADTKTYIDQKIAEISAAMLNA